MGYWFTFVGLLFAVLAAAFSLIGFLLSPKDNIFSGPRSIRPTILQKSVVSVKDSPGAIVNIMNQAEANYVSGHLIKDGVSQAVVDKLLQISKMMKEGRLREAESLLRNFKKSDLTVTDTTNIQSVRASLYLSQGKFAEAKAIYESIMDADVRSNAVYTGMATISAFEAFGVKNSDSEKSVELLTQSSEWYFRAAEIDTRPQVLVTIYHGIFDNYRVLVKHFGKTEFEPDLMKYQKLFKENNTLAGYPFGIVPEQDNIYEKEYITKTDLVGYLKSKGLKGYDLSSLPDDLKIYSFTLDTSGPLGPRLTVVHEDLCEREGDDDTSCSEFK